MLRCVAFSVYPLVGIALPSKGDSGASGDVGVALDVVVFRDVYTVHVRVADFMPELFGTRYGLCFRSITHATCINCAP